MKTTKLILAIVFFTISTLAYPHHLISDKGDLSPDLRAEISLSNAIQNQTLANYMRIYINPSFLEGPFCQRNYTIEVRTTRIVFFITGTFNEWRAFFNWHYPVSDSTQKKMVKKSYFLK